MTNDEYDKLLEKQGKGWKDWMAIKQERIANQVSIDEDKASLTIAERMLLMDADASIKAHKEWMRRSRDVDLAATRVEDEIAMEMARQGWQLEDGKFWHEPGDLRVSRIDLQPIINLLKPRPREAANPDSLPSDQEIRDAINGDI